jgi:hypothetical protein
MMKISVLVDEWTALTTDLQPNHWVDGQTQAITLRK